MSEKYSTRLLAQAICVVNKHAKTATDNRKLYALKKQAIEQLIKQQRAKKIGLHFVSNPRFSQQQSSVLISCANYYFHTLPKKEDFKLLPHLGHLDENYRNPTEHMALNRAKIILHDFLDSPTKNDSSIIRTSTNVKKRKKRKPYLKDTSYFFGH